MEDVLNARFSAGKRSSISSYVIRISASPRYCEDLLIS
jgi:hypothetical protein